MTLLVALLVASAFAALALAVLMLLVRAGGLSEPARRAGGPAPVLVPVPRSREASMRADRAALPWQVADALLDPRVAAAAWDGTTRAARH